MAEESGWTRAGTEAKAVLAAEKEESISGDQEKALGSPLRAYFKWVEKQGSTRDELPVEVDRAQKLLKGGAVGRFREAGDGGEVLAEGGGAGTGDGVAQILNSRSSEGKLLQVDVEAMEVAEVEHTAEMLLMRGQRVGENQYVRMLGASG